MILAGRKMTLCSLLRLESDNLRFKLGLFQEEMMYTIHLRCSESDTAAERADEIGQKQ